MDVKSRRESIANQLRIQGEASIAELARQFGTSEMTIRRDLDLLEMEGLARRARGGAISVVSRSYEPPILQRAAEMADAKARIGAAAAALVAENDTFALDTGTTALAMARALPDDLSVTVVTGSLLVANELATKLAVRVILTGGEVRHGELSLIGPRAQEAFDEFHCDTFFMGVAGVSAERGLTEYNADDAYVKRAALASARRVVVMADASKLGRVAFAKVAPIDEVDLLVTNGAPDDPEVQRIIERGVDVLHVEPFEKERP